MDIYLHIGTHKTGSSLIQNVCKENSDTLRKFGVYYPDIGFKQSGHHELAWSINKGNKEESQYMLNSIFNTGSAFDKILLSSEEFEFLNKHSLFNELFKKCNIYVILYLRRQDSYLESEYNQHVKMTQTKFSGDIYKFYMYHNFYNRFNYKSLVEFWKNKIGINGIKLHSYDKEKSNNNLLSSFFKDLDINSDTLTIKKERIDNKSISPSLLIYLARLNKLTNLSNKDRKEFINILEKENPKYDNEYFLDSEYRKRLVNKHRAHNKYINSNYMINETIFKNSFSVNGYVIDYYFDYDDCYYRELLYRSGIRL